MSIFQNQWLVKHFLITGFCYLRYFFENSLKYFLEEYIFQGSKCMLKVNNRSTKRTCERIVKVNNEGTSTTTMMSFIWVLIVTLTYLTPFSSYSTTDCEQVNVSLVDTKCLEVSEFSSLTKRKDKKYICLLVKSVYNAWLTN